MPARRIAHYIRNTARNRREKAGCDSYAMDDPQLPDPSQLELQRQQLIAALGDLINELAQSSRDLVTADNALELAAVTRKTLARLSEASNGWELTSETMRDRWGV
jgi:hypothetical protein